MCELNQQVEKSSFSTMQGSCFPVVLENRVCNHVENPSIKLTATMDKIQIYIWNYLNNIEKQREKKTQGAGISLNYFPSDFLLSPSQLSCLTRLRQNNPNYLSLGFLCKLLPCYSLDHWAINNTYALLLPLHKPKHWFSSH